MTKLALFFGNRGFFPESLIASAREEIGAVLTKLGIETISLPADATRYGAVETAAEGRVYAKFLEEHKGEYDGVVLSLPNFGDENGASEALRNCGVPIYVQAYPDELDKMDFDHRRDAFCGKFSIMDVFTQFNLPFTAWTPHVIDPASAEFASHMMQFAAVCRIVKKLKQCRLGAIGARPTLFKTIRFDEVALQHYGITTEVFDNSDLLVKVDKIKDNAPELLAKIDTFKKYTDFSAVPADKIAAIAKVSLALDQFIDEYQLDAIGLRCWSDLQHTLKISPCVVLGELNDRGSPAACELDMGNALSMLALNAASTGAAACLDWNNNYPGGTDDECILFHCGSIASSLMEAGGKVTDHAMFAKALGGGCGYGCNVGRIKASDFSFVSAMTLDGKIRFYSGEGKFTGKDLGKGFFGCGGSVMIPNLQQKLQTIGYNGFRHHVSTASGLWKTAIDEAFTRYLGYEKVEI